MSKPAVLGFHQNHPEACETLGLLRWVSKEWGLRFCIFNKFLPDADCSCSGARVENHWFKGTLKYYKDVLGLQEPHPISHPLNLRQVTDLPLSFPLLRPKEEAWRTPGTPAEAGSKERQG